MPNLVVKRTFKSKYPKATFSQWKQIDVFKWQVNFTFKENQYSALFDSEGNWLETVTMVPFALTPKQVRESFEGKYDATGVQQIHHVQTPTTNIYEIQWSSGVFKWKFLYDISGKIVGKLSG